MWTRRSSPRNAISTICGQEEVPPKRYLDNMWTRRSSPRKAISTICGQEEVPPKRYLDDMWTRRSSPRNAISTICGQEEVPPETLSWQYVVKKKFPRKAISTICGQEQVLPETLSRQYMDKIKFPQKCYLDNMWTINTKRHVDNKIYYGYDKRIKDYGILFCHMDTFEAPLGKKITFPQFYDLLKCNKQYIFNRKIPHGLVSAKFVRPPFFWQMVWIKSYFLNVVCL